MSHLAKILQTTCLVLLLIPAVVFAQQNGKVFGNVLTTDHEPLAYASALLKDTRYGNRVSNQGTFQIEAPQGTYKLIISYAGYEVLEKEITIQPGETLHIGDLIVQSNYNQLREVIVEDIQKNKFSRKETEGIARMPLANLQNAQVYSVATKELFQEIGAVDYNSALTQIPGIIVSNGVNDSGTGVYMRGFNADVTMRNGLPSSPRTSAEIYNLERVEVVKGPSATLFGAQVSSYGGVVNNVTKKPFESFRGEVAYTTGSWGMNRVTADVNTPLNKDHTALARFNVLGTTQNGFQDAGKQQAFAFAASLLFKPNERTTVRFDADLYSPKKTLLAYVRRTDQLSYGSMDKVPIPFNRALLSDDITTQRNNKNIGTEIEYKISEHWSSKTSYQFNQSGDEASIFFVPSYLNDEQIERNYRIFDQLTNNYNSIQQNFTGDYQVGKLKNNFVGGLDASFYESRNMSMNPTFLTYDTVGIQDAGWKPISRNDIEKSRALKGIGDSFSTTKYSNLSAYFSNVTNISDRLFVMLSARLNHYRNGESYTFTPNVDPKKSKARTLEGYNQTNLSPKIGLVFQPIKNQLSIFANYMNSFTNMPSSQGLSSDADLTVEPSLINWKPEQANQFEFGTKMELMDGKINGTISYYNILVSNKLRSVLEGVSVQDGEQRSKGFEFDLIANPISGWNIILGYGYNDHKYTKSETKTAGKRVPWAPRQVVNVWTSYKFLTGAAKGFGLGAGLNYVDRVYQDVNEKFSVPPCTTISATTFYDQPKYRVGIKMNNLSNIKYWDLYGKPQKPFEFLASLSFKF